MMPIEKLRCLFNDPACSGTKPFRTGTPFCGHHLRTVFGVDACYGQNRIVNQSVECLGPLISASPDTCHKQNTIIFPHRHIIDNICNNVVHEFPVNATLLKFLALLSCDSKVAKGKRTYIIEVLRNWLEYDIQIQDTQIKKQIESIIHEWKTAFENNVSEVTREMLMPEASYVNQNIGETNRYATCSQYPFFVQSLSLHMIPSIIEHFSYENVKFYPLTAASNVVYTPSGYVAETDLPHRDNFVLLCRAPTTTLGRLCIRRKSTHADLQEYTLSRLAEKSVKASPLTCQNLLAS
jgi:hypothetical protein